MKTFFAWQGGDGGDFVMHMIYWLAHGMKPNINQYGRQIIDKKVRNFVVDKHTLIKTHVPWKDKSFLACDQRRLILLHNPDPIFWTKKRIVKLHQLEDLQMTGKRPADKKIAQALRQKDFKTAYYWGASHWFALHKQYRKDIQNTLDTPEHLCIEHNMTTLEEVKSTITSVMEYLDIDSELSTEMISECKTYVEKQKHIIDTQWDYIV